SSGGGDGEQSTSSDLAEAIDFADDHAAPAAQAEPATTTSRSGLVRRNLTAAANAPEAPQQRPSLLKRQPAAANPSYAPEAADTGPLPAYADGAAETPTYAPQSAQAGGESPAPTMRRSARAGGLRAAETALPPQATPAPQGDASAAIPRAPRAETAGIPRAPRRQEDAPPAKEANALANLRNRLRSR
ncbi:MAG: hypothetical protein AAFR23_04010, partial [Pseudomonadota bacterium]